MTERKIWHSTITHHLIEKKRRMSFWTFSYIQENCTNGFSQQLPKKPWRPWCFFFYYEYRKYVSNNMLIPKHITCCVSIFNLYKMSLHYLHTDTLSYLVVHILTALELLSFITIGFIVNIFCIGVLFSIIQQWDTFYILFFLTTHFLSIFLHFCRPIMYHHHYYGQ